MPYAERKMVERDALKIAFVVGLVVMLMLDPLKKREAGVSANDNGHRKI